MRGTPPGLEGDLVEVTSGGDDNWIQHPPLKHYTNAFIVHKTTGRLLLGLKKRGFSQGMYNGFGGKVEPSETPLEAAKRELQEESGLVCDLQPCGILLFTVEGHPHSHYIHLYRSESFQNEPIETDEMSPEWFAIPSEYLDPSTVRDSSLPDIPYNKMWPDDEHWMPMLLRGEKFIGRADFTGEGKEEEWKMKRWWFGKEKQE